MGMRHRFTKEDIDKIKELAADAKRWSTSTNHQENIPEDSDACNIDEDESDKSKKKD